MSQIELVRMQENYDCDIDGCPAGYDGLHPNALGKEDPRLKSHEKTTLARS